jgi:tRNA(fMet)-specific endonuclease VapC
VEVKPLPIDTNAYVAFKRGDAEAVSVLQHAATLAFNTVVLGELYGGFAAGSRADAN